MSEIIRLDSGAELMASLGGDMSPAAITQVLYKAKETRAAKDRAETQLAFQSAVGLMCGVGAMCISPIGVFGVAAIVAAGGHAAHEYIRKVKPFGDYAAKLEKVFNGAPTEQWSELARTIGPESFAKCIGAALLLTDDPGTRSEACYQEAVRFAYNLGEHIEGYTAPERTALIAPAKKRGRRSGVEEPLSAPTTTELEIVADACKIRIHKKDVIARIIALNKTGEEADRQRAMDLLLVHSGLSPRDVKLSRDRFDAVKNWAKQGAALPVQPALPVVVEPVTVEEPIAVLPVAPIVLPAVEPVEEPIAVIEEDDEDEYEEELDDEEIEEEPIAVVEAVRVPIAVAPTFQRIKSEISIWDTTDLDTIAPADIGNVNQFPIVMVVAEQGAGKTSTMAYIFEALEGCKVMYTPKMDDHRNPAIGNVYDLMFGYNPVTDRAAWYGTPESFDNSPMMDLDWYLNIATNKTGSALDFIHAANQTATNRTACGRKKGRKTWRVFYDEAAVTYRAGFNRVVVDGVSLGTKGRQECQEFIAANLIPAIFNWRGAGVQLFLGCQSETVESVGLKGCAEARDEAWHLYPGLAAIEVAKEHKQSKLAAFLQRAISDGYAIAILEKKGQKFKIIRMPKLADLARFDPIDDEALEQVTTIEPEQSYEDDFTIVAAEESIEEATATDQEVEGIKDTTDRMAQIRAIMALDIPVAMKTQLIAEVTAPKL